MADQTDRLPAAGRVLNPDARERLARHWWVTDGGTPELWDKIAAGEHVDAPWWQVALDGRNDYLTKADALLAVITGEHPQPDPKETRG